MNFKKYLHLQSKLWPVLLERSISRLETSDMLIKRALFDCIISVQLFVLWGNTLTHVLHKIRYKKVNNLQLLVITLAIHVAVIEVVCHWIRFLLGYTFRVRVTRSCVVIQLESNHWYVSGSGLERCLFLEVRLIPVIIVYGHSIHK